MGRLITVDIRCDRCPVWARGVTGGHTGSMATRAREEARKQGFRRVRIGEEFLDLCPDCLREKGAGDGD